MNSFQKFGPALTLAAALTACSKPNQVDTESTESRSPAIVSQVQQNTLNQLSPELKNIESEINNILKTGNTLQAISFIKKHTTQWEFVYFADKMAMLIVDNQYPWFLGPWFFLPDFVRTKSEWKELKIGSELSGKESWVQVDSIESIMTLLDIKNAFNSISPERKKLYHNYYTAAKNFYDNNKSEIDTLVSDYHENEEKVSAAQKNNPELAAVYSIQEEKFIEIYWKYGIKTSWIYDIWVGIGDIDVDSRNKQKAGLEYHDWLVKTLWPMETKILKRVANVPYHTSEGWDVSEYMQPKLKVMKWYKELQRHHDAIHTERLKTKESAVSWAVAEWKADDIHFLTVKALYRWFWNPAKRAFLEQIMD